MTLRVYFDVSCLNRPYDDQAQQRIRLEAEAVFLISARTDCQIIGSDVVQFEIEQTPDPDRREQVAGLSRVARETVYMDDRTLRRAWEIQSLGIPGVDAFHLACAEQGRVDVFLTTDDRLIRRAKRLEDRLNVRVENPLAWLRGIENL
jgi:predicted nucleic acid-binding protein